MTELQLAIWSFPVLLLLVFLRMPIALAMAAVGFGGCYMIYGTALPVLNSLKNLTYGTFSNYSFSISWGSAFFLSSSRRCVIRL